MLELLALPELRVREIRGELEAGGKRARFHWKADLLSSLGAGQGAPLSISHPERVDSLAAAFRRERERSGASEWGIGRPAHVIAAAGGALLPHLELRRGDRRLFLRLGEDSPTAAAALDRFTGKTPVAILREDPSGAPVLRLPGGQSLTGEPAALLSLAQEWLERLDTPAAPEWKAPVLKAA